MTTSRQSNHDEATIESSGRFRPRVVLAIGALVVVVGVGAWLLLSSDSQSDQTVTTEDTAGSETLDGAYVLVSGTVDGAPVPIVSGSEPTLTIDGNQWGGRAACNSYGTEVEVADDGALTLGEVAITEMGCEPPLMESEATYISGFWRVDRAVADGSADLVLLGDGVELGYKRETPVDDGGPVTDVDWRLDTIVEGDLARHSPPPWGSLRLGSDGTLFATGPCVTLTGEYVFDGIELQSTSMVADYAASCGGEPGADDNAVISIIESSRPEVTDGGQRLTLSQGSDQLVYLRGDQVDLPAPPPPGEESGSGPIAAVTPDLRLVEFLPDGSEERLAIDLRDAIPGIDRVDTVALDDARSLVYLGVRRADAGSSACDGAVTQVDFTGAATAVADGITPALSPDGSALAFGTIERVGDICTVTGVGLVDVDSGDRVDIDIDDVPDRGTPDWNLSWWPDSSRVVVAYAGDITAYDRWADNSAPEEFVLDRPLLMAVRSSDGFVGMAGCCADEMSLATEADALASLDAPIESIRVVGDSLVMVDAVGALLHYAPATGLVVIGDGYVAADAAVG